jgi:hypothetical protein
VSAIRNVRIKCLVVKDEGVDFGMRLGMLLAVESDSIKESGEINCQREREREILVSVTCVCWHCHRNNNTFCALRAACRALCEVLPQCSRRRSVYRRRETAIQTVRRLTFAKTFATLIRLWLNKCTKVSRQNAASYHLCLPAFLFWTLLDDDGAAAWLQPLRTQLSER